MSIVDRKLSDRLMLELTSGPWLSFSRLESIVTFRGELIIFDRGTLFGWSLWVKLSSLRVRHSALQLALQSTTPAPRPQSRGPQAVDWDSAPSQDLDPSQVRHVYSAFAETDVEVHIFRPPIESRALREARVHGSWLGFCLLRRLCSRSVGFLIEIKTDGIDWNLKRVESVETYRAKSPVKGKAYLDQTSMRGSLGGSRLFNACRHWVRVYAVMLLGREVSHRSIYWRRPEVLK
ncbi:hypothetical protein BHM03_00002222 [Ensete ventricosum]|nr:hypothetical protein BHM03_00002222 [Ensete ventricosum]